ncbi:MAG: hypothetical protein FJ100_18525 [Deltaproteobacteria bacterium]|nr:hypothetical protein [Deltaproteobacteria bacterium]
MLSSQRFRLLGSVARLAVFAAVCAACQPARLDTAQVTGTVAGADAAADADAKVSAGETTDIAAQPETAVPDGGGVGDGGSTDIADDDAGPKCTSDGDCTKAGTCELGFCVQGKCAYSSKPDTAACTDGNPCTAGEACLAGKCVGGTATSCDDKNTCTIDSCDTTKGCLNTAKTTGACDDGIACTTADHCEAGVCVGSDVCPCKSDADCPTLNACDGPRMCDTAKVPYKCISKNEPKKCPDDLPSDCTVTFCDKATGECASKAAADEAKCEDGFGLCTANDLCKNGACVTGTKICECMGDGDCAKYNKPEDLCAPKYYCDKAGKADGWACKVNPATVIKCDKASDGPCKKNVCNSKNGFCLLTNVNAPGSFVECDDGLKATEGDYCDDDGVCKGSAFVAQCTTTADCAKLEDGDVCNGTLFCNKAAKPPSCQLNPATVVKCPTALDSVCSKTLCNKATGKCEVKPTERLGKSCPVDDPNCDAYVFLPEGASPIVVPCDDGDVCTGSSSCKSGKCAAEPTAFVCGCKADADCAAKEDGNKCNGTLFCNKVKGKCEINQSTIVNCSTVNDGQCAKNVCDPVSGQCKLTEIGAPGNYVPCEDGNLCTQFDDCEGGACVSGTNTCACTKDEECVDDGDLCNGTLFCNKASGACVTNPKTVVSCSNSFDTACLKNTCDKKSGKCVNVAVSDYLNCEDGNPCSEGDVCLKGDCVSGTNTCDCVENKGCEGKEDGNPCNGTLYCNMKATPFKCLVNPATIVTCPIGLDTDCLKNTCDKLTGKCAMKPVPQLFAPCTDNNPCTVDDECINGTCKAGTNFCNCLNDADCAAKEQTNNLCVGKLGCLTIDGKKLCTTIPNSAVTCAADAECTKNLCDAGDGKCKAVSDESFCNDGNPCTAESCTLGKCVHTKLSDGAVCGNNKLCSNGVCFAKQ